MKAFLGSHFTVSNRDVKSSNQNLMRIGVLCPKSAIQSCQDFYFIHDILSQPSLTIPWHLGPFPHTSTHPRLTSPVALPVPCSFPPSYQASTQHLPLHIISHFLMANKHVNPTDFPITLRQGHRICSQKSFFENYR